MKTKVMAIMIILLIIGNIAINVSYYQFKNTVGYTVLTSTLLSKEYSTLKTSLVYSIMNDGDVFEISNNCKEQDSLISNMFSKSVDKILVCRISDKHCSSCVASAVNLFKKATYGLNQDNIAYFLESRNNNSYKSKVQSYSIADKKFYNVSLKNLKSEYASFPYFMIIDSSLRVLATYFPNKSTNNLDSIFVRKMCNRIEQSSKTNRSIKIDLGDFKYGVSNTIACDFFSEENTVIDKITSSCECVKAEIDKSIIAKGDHAKIAIVYEAEQIGNFYREIYIWGKSNEKLIATIELKGNAI